MSHFQKRRNWLVPTVVLAVSLRHERRKEREHAADRFGIQCDSNVRPAYGYRHRDGGATSFCGDRIEGTGGDDSLIGDRYGTPCFDTKVGKGGDDLMKGLRFPDELYGGNGADTLTGNRGGDRLEGGRDKDLMYGGSGDDVIYAQDGTRDVIYCGPGFDEVYHDERDYRGLEQRGDSAGRGRRTGKGRFERP